jgi:hypothetical protein
MIRFIEKDSITREINLLFISFFKSDLTKMKRNRLITFLAEEVFE